MDYVRLGNTGLKVSRLCLGCMTYGSSKWRTWVLDEEAGAAVLQAGDRGRDQLLRHRRRLLPGRERAGHRQGAEGIRQAPRGGASPPRSTARWAPTPTTAACRASTSWTASTAACTRLGVDYVDLYQIHRFDYDTPIEETLEALNDVVRAGKARYIGASSMYAWQFMKMLDASRANGWTPFVSMQPQYNLVYREEEREMLPLCHDQGVGVIPWSPLARGFLAGGRGSAGEGNTERARTDEFSAAALLPRARPRGGRRAGAVGQGSAASPTCRWRWPGC